jgi:hypothetical protein
MAATTDAPRERPAVVDLLDPRVRGQAVGADLMSRIEVELGPAQSGRREGRSGQRRGSTSLARRAPDRARLTPRRLLVGQYPQCVVSAGGCVEGAADQALDRLGAVT